MFDFNKGIRKPVPSGKRPAPQVPTLDEDEYYFKENYKVVFKDRPWCIVKDVIKVEIKDKVVIFTSVSDYKLQPMINTHNIVIPPKPTAIFNLDSILYYQSIDCNLGFNDEAGE